MFRFTLSKLKLKKCVSIFYCFDLLLVNLNSETCNSFCCFGSPPKSQNKKTHIIFKGLQKQKLL